eukprot:TRINITY_DN16886_c0_g1_i2.p1 TRINITY_DN16886_c0_g1~~TRINITY_DN16886_c0_g1_i2.p1  ORF type:complete len:156 (+),score=28.96 TRINITY_DN16886_c0_g1_i2:529-996(+)
MSRALRRSMRSAVHHARLATLFRSNPEFDQLVPPMSLFLTDAPDTIPAPWDRALSVAAIRKIVSYNSFALPANEKQEQEHAAQLAGACSVEDFTRWCGMSGTGLFALSAFMNHEEDSNTCRRFVGDYTFVFAERPLAAGVELTTYYSDDIRHWLK